MNDNASDLKPMTFVDGLSIGLWIINYHEAADEVDEPSSAVSVDLLVDRN